MHKDSFEAYRLFLEDLDRQCAGLFKAYAGCTACRKGCDECCVGIPVLPLERAYLAWGLSQAGRQDLLARLQDLDAQSPDGIADFTGAQEAGPVLQGDAGVQGKPGAEGDPGYRCIFLSGPQAGHCLAYPWRPLICRVHGLPLLYPLESYDESGRRMDTPEDREYVLRFCDLNFEGLDDDALLMRGYLDMEELNGRLQDLDRQWRQGNKKP